MSKAKAKAREWIEYYNKDWEDYQHKSEFLIAFANSFFDGVLEGRYDAEPEPEPELKGLEYQILESDDSEDLAKIVNYAISDGWKPSGSLVVVFAHQTRYEVNEIYFKYAQAMIKGAS
jgi:hypothetical protein